VFQVVYVYYVPKKSREKSPAAKGNNAKICGNPETKGVVVIQIGRVEGEAPGSHRASSTPQNRDVQDADPNEKRLEGTSFDTLWK
jgi:hypothetical protein